VGTILTCLDPDPPSLTQLNPDPIRIRIRNFRWQHGKNFRDIPGSPDIEELRGRVMYRWRVWTDRGNFDKNRSYK
jgi:hypothetical protein